MAGVNLGAPTRGARTTSSSRKNPCGKCQDECSSGTAVVCGFCELWYHSKCIDGMSPEFIKCCDAMNKAYGGSSFLCFVCRKIIGSINHSMKDMEKRMSVIEQQLTTAMLERKCMTAKIEHLESKDKQVNENLQKMEGEVASGMEKAKEEVKGEMRDELKEREDKKENIVIYGLNESAEPDGRKRKDEDDVAVKNLAAEIGVQFNGEIRTSYRAGPKSDGGRPRPLIVTIEDEETREGILTNARRLYGKDLWKRVFVSHDLTWRQREEIRKVENKLKEEAGKKTEEGNGAGREGKCIVVGPRGRRRFKWVTEIRDQ